MPESQGTLSRLLWTRFLVDLRHADGQRGLVFHSYVLFYNILKRAVGIFDKNI